MSGADHQARQMQSSGLHGPPTFARYEKMKVVLARQILELLHGKDFVVRHLARRSVRRLGTGLNTAGLAITLADWNLVAVLSHGRRTIDLRQRCDLPLRRPANFRHDGWAQTTACPRLN